MKPRSRDKHQGRKESGTFLLVPSYVLFSPNFCALSLKAKALILDIGARFNGYNNGDLAAPWSWMKERGWRSKDTLHRALTELLQAGMIEQTRQGGLFGPSLYAFTWRAIDESKGKADIVPTRVASGKWKIAGQSISAPAKLEVPPRLSGKPAPTSGLDLVKTGAK